MTDPWNVSFEGPFGNWGSCSFLRRNLIWGRRLAVSHKSHLLSRYRFSGVQLETAARCRPQLISGGRLAPRSQPSSSWAYCFPNVSTSLTCSCWSSSIGVLFYWLEISSHGWYVCFLILRCSCCWRDAAWCHYQLGWYSHGSGPHWDNLLPSWFGLSGRLLVVCYHSSSFQTSSSWGDLLFGQNWASKAWSEATSCCCQIWGCFVNSRDFAVNEYSVDWFGRGFWGWLRLI